MSWTNDKPLNLRQRAALKLISIAIKIIEPYQFAHEFEKEWSQFENIINGKIVDPNEKAKKK